jgi:hypothetical protein
MKRLFTFVCFSFCALTQLKAQDSTTHEPAPKWRFSAGINLITVPTYNIVGIDTGFNNSLSLGPTLSLGNSSGFAFSYSPRFVMGGTNKGLYMHAVSVGFSRYDLPVFDYAITYGHYFFTGNKSVPYSPMSNEIYGDLTYKKTWLRPYIAAGIGFGKDTSARPASSVSDIGLTAGFSHSFDWESGDVGFSMIPSVGVNAGTNNYFSFLNITRYIGHNSNSVGYVKKGSGGTARSGGRRGGGTSTGGGGTTTTTTTAASQGFGITNVQLNLESSIDINNLAIRPTVSLFIPVGNAATGNSTTAFWQLVFEYKF